MKKQMEVPSHLGFGDLTAEMGRRLVAVELGKCYHSHMAGSKIGAQDGTLVNGNMD